MSHPIQEYIFCYIYCILLMPRSGILPTFPIRFMTIHFPFSVAILTEMIFQHFPHYLSKALNRKVAREQLSRGQREVGSLVCRPTAWACALMLCEICHFCYLSFLLIHSFFSHWGLFEVKASREWLSAQCWFNLHSGNRPLRPRVGLSMGCEPWRNFRTMWEPFLVTKSEGCNWLILLYTWN